MSTLIKTYYYSTTPPQKYTGETLFNNLHGSGFYSIENETLFYDGFFYANKLEGYCQIFNADGSNFQGLFKDNKRFGPGVYTHVDGEQDVGLWDGFSIARLGTTVHSFIVPRLGSTSVGKLKLLKYRYLVPVCTERDQDEATRVLKRIGASDKILKDASKLYNPSIRNKNSPFFNKKEYDERFFKEDCAIDILVIEDDQDLGDEKISRTSYDLKSISSRIEQLRTLVKDIDDKVKVIKDLKGDLSDKVAYCRLCCYDPDSRRSSSKSQKSDIFVELKVPDNERESSFQEEKSFIESINFDDDISYHTFIDMANKETDFPEIERYLQNICVCDEGMQAGDLIAMENELEILTRQETFYESILKYLTMKLNFTSKKLEKRNDLKTRKIIINDILAWNNEPLYMEMLKHSFLHRHSENMVTFKVSYILAGQRSKFALNGEQERHCNHFLTECCLGEGLKVIEYLRYNHINVNVTDARGNSGVFFAAAKSRPDIIKILVNFGAKLDQVNDEGLTPLTMCLLIYLADENDIHDWETSFLPDTNLASHEEKEVRRWYPNKSFLSIGSESSVSSGSIVENVWCIGDKNKYSKKVTVDLQQCKYEPTEYVQKSYLFDTAFRPPVRNAQVIMDKTHRKCSDESVSLKDFAESSLTSIESTINALLECGANPNVGEVPMPALILSVFGENRNLVQKVLVAGADVNVVIPEGNLNCLHIVASLKCKQENIDICEVLLKHFCDPNMKTSTSHWPEQKTRILGKGVDPDAVKDYGKTPLQLLCLRQDFPADNCSYFHKISDLLISAGASLNDTYLGQNALSLAILSGNFALVEAFITSGLIDPYAVLENNVGNVITLLLANKYEGILPLEQCKQMLDLLVELGVNPLQPIGNFENAIKFAENIDAPTDSNKPKKGTGKLPKKDKNDQQNVLKNHLKELARQVVIKYIQMEAVEHLYDLAEENMLHEDCVNILAEYLSPVTVIEDLKSLFNCGKIDSARLNKKLILEILEFVEEHKTTRNKTGKSVKPDGLHKGTIPVEKPKLGRNYTAMLDVVKFEEITPTTSKARFLKPDLENYRICFQCLQRLDEKLIACPKCQFIYFCSDHCNKLNLKTKSRHPCGVNVFDGSSNRDDLASKSLGGLKELCAKAKENCKRRLLEKEREAVEKQQRKEEVERKLDIYGTKFLERKKNTASKTKFPTKTVTQISLVDIASMEKRNKLNYGRSLGGKERKLVPSVDEKLRRLSNIDSKSIDMLKEKTVSIKFAELKQKKVQTQKKRVKKFKETEGAKEEKIKHKVLTSAHVASPFEPLPCLDEPYVTIKKLKKMPTKPQYFMELLGEFFPDVDLSFLLLPYICYSEGHLYYRFLDDEFFCSTYSST